MDGTSHECSVQSAGRQKEALHGTFPIKKLPMRPHDTFSHSNTHTAHSTTPSLSRNYITWRNLVLILRQLKYQQFPGNFAPILKDMSQRSESKMKNSRTQIQLVTEATPRYLTCLFGQNGGQDSGGPCSTRGPGGPLDDRRNHQFWRFWSSLQGHTKWGLLVDK